MADGLDPVSVRDSVLTGSRLWSRVSVVAETGSTNADLVAAARAGAAEGAVLVAERQHAGRGRLGRPWISEPGAALTFSVLLRPVTVPAAARSWLPLLTGVAVAAGIREQTGLDVSLKWPNDVVAAGGDGQAGLGKLAGILAELAGDAVVLGVGLNVAATPALAGAGAVVAEGTGAARGGADRGGADRGGADRGGADRGGADQRAVALAPASLASIGAAGLDRAALLTAILRQLEHWYLRWSGESAAGDAVASGLRAEYLRSCRTVGREVRVELPGGAVLTGRACDVDGAGRLLVASDSGVEPVSAGDVIHVR
jgi:BirA family transcriptional regulator, biotin operon repressor / biotin---[acetyl-CoA-carboxylase] ligase